jgi:hypothetical protein
VILYGLWHVLQFDMKTLQRYKIADAGDVYAVLRAGRAWFWIVVLAHLVPLWFFSLNWLVANRRWDAIREKRQGPSAIDPIALEPWPQRIGRGLAGMFRRSASPSIGHGGPTDTPAADGGGSGTDRE